MSLKYQRVKKADESLPAPLRWLTRAFSSITLAVVLLVCIALYGVIASMPLVFLLLLGVYVLIGVGTVGLAALALWQVHKRTGVSGLAFNLAAFVAIAGAVALAIFASLQANHSITATQWFKAWHATVIYRLPWFEMTELQFYAWWPMQLLLGLFVLNMIWATIRRIEFKFVNIGVLTVHTGIVVLAVGAILYGHFKFEGDMIIRRRDLGGTFHDTFYDAFTPAIYLTADTGEALMIPLPELPRYNDYTPGSPAPGTPGSSGSETSGGLNIRLDDRPGVAEVVGDGVRVSIPGFLAYADLQSGFVDASDLAEGLSQAEIDKLPENVVVQLASGSRDQIDLAGDKPVRAFDLVASSPAQRVGHFDTFDVELLTDANPQRVADLTRQIDAPHGLIVRIPEQHFEQAYAIEPGQTIALGDTGYTLEVQDVGPYAMPFITEGYQGASDTRATVRLTGQGKDFRRIVMYRYPERSQDFTPAPDDPGVGPMGKRTDPDPAIELVYIDNTRAQYHLIDRGAGESLELVLRLPFMNAASGGPLSAPLREDKFLVPGTFNGHPHWLHVTRRMRHATPTLRAAPTPKAMRDPKDEGDYTHAVVPVLFEQDLRAADGTTRTWRQVIWLKQMRYPQFPEDMRRPVYVDLPSGRQVAVIFSRQQHRLPFAVALEAFKMIPIPGSEVERDFVATLAIGDLNALGVMAQRPEQVEARLNSPVIHRTPGAPLGLRSIKLSQIAWDKGDPSAPGHLARDEQGRFVNQQRFTILGVANNVGIRIIFVGACLIVIGIPWAFYVKPALQQRRKRKIQRELEEKKHPQMNQMKTD